MSEGSVNPRHVYGCYLFINHYGLLDKSDERYSTHDRAKAFLDGRAEANRST